MSDVPALTLPQPELVVVDFLHTIAEVTDIVAERIYSTVPPEAVFPLLRVRQIPGGRLDAHNLLWQARMQIDGWADGSWLAGQLVRRAHAALRGVRNWEHTNLDGDRCWLNGISNVVAPGPSPDPDTNKPRWMFDCHAHLRVAAAA